MCELEGYINYEFPDKADLLTIGAKSRHMKMSSKVRQEARRVWKGKERGRVRAFCSIAGG